MNALILSFPDNRILAILMSITLVGLSCSVAAVPSHEKPLAPSGSTRVTAESFVYPVGTAEAVTEARDSVDDWYNAQDFGENRHLGEDWNKNSGGDSDCGERVRAAAEGKIVFAGDAGPGWGNVVIITHLLPDGTEVQTLYGDLEKIEKRDGTVEVGEKIGAVGNADGTYLCHLHFELRKPECRFWNQTGPGYSDNSRGWLDPSDFIDARIKTTPSR